MPFQPTKCLICTEFGLLVYTTRSCIWHVIHICMRECDVACFDAVLNLAKIRRFIRTTTKLPSMDVKEEERRRELVSEYLCRVECASGTVHKCVWLLTLFELLFSSYIPNCRLLRRCRQSHAYNRLHSPPFVYVFALCFQQKLYSITRLCTYISMLYIIPTRLTTTLAALCECVCVCECAYVGSLTIRHHATLDSRASMRIFSTILFSPFESFVIALQNHVRRQSVPPRGELKRKHGVRYFEIMFESKELVKKTGDKTHTYIQTSSGCTMYVYMEIVL